MTAPAGDEAREDGSAVREGADATRQSADSGVVAGLVNAGVG